MANESTDNQLTSISPEQRSRAFEAALRPEARKALKDQRAKGNNPLIVLSLNNDAPAFEFASSHAGRAKSVMLVGRESIVWNAELVSLALKTSDAIEFATAPFTPELQQTVDQIARTLGVEKNVKGVFDPEVKFAGVMRSREGDLYLLMNPQINGQNTWVIAHELGHIAAGHVELDYLVKDWNLSKRDRLINMRAIEHEADRFVVKMCDGDAMIGALRRLHDQNLKLAGNTRELEQLYNQSIHPQPLERAQLIAEGMGKRRAEGECVASSEELPPAPTTPNPTKNSRLR